MSDWRNSVLLSALLVLAASAFVEELDDSFMETRGAEDVWLIKFYTPWCTFCKQLDPVWHQIGSELKSRGSPINVGKCDASVSTALAKEFRVRSYPAILMLKKGLKYNYPGPRTKDAIMDFADRVSGPLVRPVRSAELFQTTRSRYDVMFLYVGATSLLKANYTAAAEELIVHTVFFSGSRDVLPQDVSLPSLPAVVVFKDGTYLTFNEHQDGDLKVWINRERFPGYSRVDSYSLYAMGESGKLVVLVLLEETGLSKRSQRCKLLCSSVAAAHKDVYSRHFLFGFMEGNEYVNGLVMSDVSVPSFIILDLAVDGYFLPLVAVETEQHLLDFLNGVLNGSVESRGGNGIHQRVRRLVYDINVTLTPIFVKAPLLGLFLVLFPVAMATIFCYLCCKARTNMADDEDEDADSVALLAPSLQRHKKSANKKAD